MGMVKPHNLLEQCPKENNFFLLMFSIKVLGDICGECNMGRRVILSTPWGFSHALKIVDAVLRGISQVSNICVL